MSQRRGRPSRSMLSSTTPWSGMCCSKRCRTAIPATSTVATTAPTTIPASAPADSSGLRLQTSPDLNCTSTMASCSMWRVRQDKWEPCCYSRHASLCSDPASLKAAYTCPVAAVWLVERGCDDLQLLNHGRPPHYLLPGDQTGGAFLSSICSITSAPCILTLYSCSRQTRQSWSWLSTPFRQVCPHTSTQA